MITPKVRWWRTAILGGACAVLPVVAQGQIFLMATAESPPAVAPDSPASPTAEDDDFVDEYATSGVRMRDPFERVNRTMFKFNNTVYDRVLTPIVRGYQTVVPAPARRGLVSFFANVRFPVRFAGSLLQGKFNRAAAETGKFVVNSTVGLAGFIKVSDRFPRLRVPEEDFGQAFGAWGIGNGPFIVLPVLGPSSVREVFGRVGDYFATPMSWQFMDQFSWEERVAVSATDVVSELPDLLRTVDSLRQSAVDPYIAFRNGYAQFREGEVKR